MAWGEYILCVSFKGTPLLFQFDTSQNAVDIYFFPISPAIKFKAGTTKYANLCSSNGVTLPCPTAVRTAQLLVLLYCVGLDKTNSTLSGYLYVPRSSSLRIILARSLCESQVGTAPCSVPCDTI